MKEKDFDNLLKDRLSDYRAEPPADMWARIESTMDRLDRGETPVAEPIRIRRPRRMRNGLYAAVGIAACFTLVILFRALNLEVEEPGGTIATVTGEVIYDPARMAGTHTDEEIAGDAAAHTESAAVAAAADPIAITGPTVIPTPQERGLHSDPELEGPIQGETGDPEKGNKPQDKTSDTKGGGGFVENSDQAGAETAPPARRTSPEATRYNYNGGNARQVPVTRQRINPISTSLFAQNTGFGSGVAEQNTTRARLSSMSLQETNGSGNNVLVYDEFKHRLPISVGITVDIPVWKDLSVETGVLYTYMYSSAEATGQSQWKYSVKQKLHYIGIPIRMKYNIIGNHRFGLYASMGGTLERNVSAKQTFSIITSGSSNGGADQTTEKITFKPNGIQASVGANLGGEVKIDNNFSFYAEPGVSYYFKNHSQPDSYRTDNPLSFSLRAGFRVSFR